MYIKSLCLSSEEKQYILKGTLYQTMIKSIVRNTHEVVYRKKLNNNNIKFVVVLTKMYALYLINCKLFNLYF